MDGFAKRLAKLRREAQREWKRRTKERKRPPPKRDARRPVDWRQVAATLLHGALRLFAIVALPFVVLVRSAVFYYGYSLLYVSQVNAKADAVRAYYTAVHPLLRLALSTWILVDPDIVITDTRRAREDYPRMKLPVNETSLHYRQADGWVHAVDLRTARRGWLRSRLVQAYFWAMGFG